MFSWQVAHLERPGRYLTVKDRWCRCTPPPCSTTSALQGVRAHQQELRLTGVVSFRFMQNQINLTKYVKE